MIADQRSAKHQAGRISPTYFKMESIVQNSIIATAIAFTCCIAATCSGYAGWERTCDTQADTTRIEEQGNFPLCYLPFELSNTTDPNRLRVIKICI